MNTEEDEVAGGWECEEKYQLEEERKAGQGKHNLNFHGSRCWTLKIVLPGAVSEGCSPRIVILGPAGDQVTTTTMSHRLSGPITKQCSLRSSSLSFDEVIMIG
jgi:hypothetical protein